MQVVNMSLLRYVDSPFDNDDSLRMKMANLRSVETGEAVTRNMVIIISSETITRNELISKILDSQYSFAEAVELMRYLEIDIDLDTITSYYLDYKVTVHHMDKNDVINEIKSYYSVLGINSQPNISAFVDDSPINIFNVIQTLYLKLAQIDTNSIIDTHRLFDRIKLPVTDLTLIVLYVELMLDRTNPDMINEMVDTVNQFQQYVQSPLINNIDILASTVIYLSDLLNDLFVTSNLNDVWLYLNRNRISISENDLSIMYAVINQNNGVPLETSLTAINEFFVKYNLSTIRDVQSLTRIINSWLQNNKTQVEFDNDIVKRIEGIYMKAGTELQIVRDVLKADTLNQPDINTVFWNYIYEHNLRLTPIGYDVIINVPSFIAIYSIARDEIVYDATNDPVQINDYNQITLDQINLLLTDDRILTILTEQFATLDADSQSLFVDAINNRSFASYDVVQAWSDIWWSTTGQFEPKIVTPFRVTEITAGSFPKIVADGVSSEVDVSDGIFIFDQSNPNSDVPYIRYNKPVGKKSFIKIYQGINPDEETEYDKLILTTDSFNDNDTIFFKVSQQEQTSNKNEPVTYESYVSSRFDLTSGRLEFKVKVNKGVQSAQVIDSIHSAFPMMQITEKFIAGVNGKFNVYNTQFDIKYFIHAIVTDPVLRTFFYVQEGRKSVAEQQSIDKKIKIDYMPLIVKPQVVIIDGVRRSVKRKRTSRATLRFTIDQAYAVDNEKSTVMFNVKNGRGSPTVVEEGVDLSARDPYIIVNVSEARSMDDVYDFMKVFANLIRYYEINLQYRIAQLYNYLFPDLLVTKAPQKKKNKITSKIEALHEFDRNSSLEDPSRPLIFENPGKKTVPYSKKCQCRRQPVIIGPEDVDAWKKYLVPHKGQLQERDVLMFPPPPTDPELAKDHVPEFYFTCPGNIFPFAGVQKIPETWSNKDYYGGLPCCFEKPQLTGRGTAVFNRLYRGVQTKSSSGSQYKIGSNRILPPDRYGGPLPLISRLMANSPVYSPEYEIIRKGVIHGFDSFLHCIFEATSPDYRTTTDENKVALVARWRQEMIDQTNMGLLRQEMYDFSEEEILSLLANPDIYFDPQRFYRLLEDWLEINIYVITNKVGKGVDSEPYIEIPRHKLFHVRPNPRNSINPENRRDTVIVYKHWGTTSSPRDYPLSELIMLRHNGGDRTKDIATFPASTGMDEYMWNIMYSQEETITWTFTDDKYSIPAYLNVFSQINYQELFSVDDESGQPLSVLTDQVIDRNGKARAFVLETTTINGQLFRSTIMIPPGQPQNLQLININQLPTADYMQVLSIFTEAPTAVTIVDGMVTGFWYRLMELTNGIYCPINPVAISTVTAIGITTVTGPANPLVPTGINRIARLRQLKKTVKIYLESVLWLYTIWQSENPGLEYITFFNNYVVEGINDDIVDTLQLYDPSAIDRRWPINVTFQQAFDYLMQRFIGFIVNGQIYAYNRKFYDGIEYFLRDYVNKTEGLPITIPRGIETLLEDRSDFIQKPRVLIFTSVANMNKWVKSLNSPAYQNTETRLDYGYAKRKQPYIYYSKNHNKFYLVQNVRNERIGKSDLTDRIVLNRAINVAYQWYLKHVNIGYTDDEFMFDADGLYPAFVVNSISSGHDLIDVEDHTNGETPFLQLLRYQQSQYAALLPLL